jgi:hypothetical protein
VEIDYKERKRDLRILSLVVASHNQSSLSRSGLGAVCFCIVISGRFCAVLCEDQQRGVVVIARRLAADERTMRKEAGPL